MQAVLSHFREWKDMHPDLTWTDFKTFDRNKLWCSGISCFVLLKKRDDVCGGGTKIPISSLLVIILFKCE